MNIQVKIKNLDKFAAGLKQAPREITKRLDTAIWAAAGVIEQDAQDIIRTGRGYSKRPYDTGDMMDQTRRQNRRALYAEVQPNVEYAIYPHEGLGSSTRYGRRPFMEDAIKAKQSQIERLIGDQIEIVLTDIAKSV